MFLPRPIFIANSNDEIYYERQYNLANVGGRFFFKSSYKSNKSPSNKGRYTQFIKQPLVLFKKNKCSKV